MTYHITVNLDSLSEDECKSEFRFDKRDIYRLRDVFEIPKEIRCYNGMVFDKEEALCILFKRFAYPEVTHAKGALLDNCLGFVDGTTRSVCRQGKNQRFLYNGGK